MRDAGLLGGQGIIVGNYRDKFLSLPGKQSVMLSAPTRSGKGVGVVVPNLLTWPDCAVVVDIKGGELRDHGGLPGGARPGRLCLLALRRRRPRATAGTR